MIWRRMQVSRFGLPLGTVLLTFCQNTSVGVSISTHAETVKVMDRASTDGSFTIAQTNGVNRPPQGRQGERAKVIDQEPDGERHEFEQQVHDGPALASTTVAILR